MDSMTEKQRAEFVVSHVRAILKAYEEFFGDISKLSLEERDEYIHSRALRDLAVNEELVRDLNDIVLRLRKQSDRQTNTASLLFLVNGIEHIARTEAGEEKSE